MHNKLLSLTLSTSFVWWPKRSNAIGIVETKQGCNTSILSNLTFFRRASTDNCRCRLTAMVTCSTTWDLRPLHICMAASAATMQYNTDLLYRTLVHHPNHFAEYTTGNTAKATQLQGVDQTTWYMWLHIYIYIYIRIFANCMLGCRVWQWDCHDMQLVQCVLQHRCLTTSCSCNNIACSRPFEICIICCKLTRLVQKLHAGQGSRQTLTFPHAVQGRRGGLSLSQGTGLLHSLGFEKSASSLQQCQPKPEIFLPCINDDSQDAS